MPDYKSLTLDLFHQEVTVALKTDSDSFAKYGESISGILIRRVWGYSDYSGKLISTVVGITLQLKSGAEINIPCSEIINMGKLIL